MIFKLLTICTLLTQVKTGCLSESIYEALSWDMLVEPAVVTGAEVICKAFYAKTNAKACVDLAGLKNSVIEKTKGFAETYFKEATQTLKGIDVNTEVFATEKKKIADASAEASQAVKDSFTKASSFIDKYTVDPKEILTQTKECSKAQQINAFGSFCLLSSSLASDYLTTDVLSNAGEAIVKVKLASKSALEVANRCTSFIQNTCVMLEMKKSINAFKEEAFSSSLESKCSSSFFDCVYSADDSSNSKCPVNIKTKMFTDFTSKVGQTGIDEATKKLLDDYSENATELFDKLTKNGFGEIKEGAEAQVNSLKNSLANFSGESIKNTIDNTLEDIKNNIDDNIKNSIPDIKSPFRFRILASDATITFEVSESGYDCYETGKDSGWETIESVNLITPKFLLILFNFLVFNFFK